METTGASWQAGLSQADAQARLREEGFNELPTGDGRGILRIVADVLKEPMFSLLLAAGAIYLLLGDLGEAIVLLAFATLSVLITVVQETRSERVLAALRDQASPRALVIRDGERRRIPGREVVRGDTIVVLEGDRIPADAVVVSASSLVVDESLLTGESVPVSKTAGDTGAAIARPGGENTPYLYSGTLAVHGEGVAVVRATGPNSELGRIGQSLKAIAPEPPRLQVETRRLVRIFATVGAVATVAVVLIIGLTKDDWLQAVLGGIALGMSLLPEEFPLVLTAFMVMGAWRLSRVRVLTRRASAIEMLGAATVLCSDKTGTMTQNRMTLAEVRTLGTTWRTGQGAPGAEAVALIEAARRASSPEPSDPMERAIAAEASSTAGGKLLRRYGLQPTLLAMSHVWQDEDGGRSVATKGAPEAVGALCRLDPAGEAWLHRAVEDMAIEGMRVLGVARGRLPDGLLPDAQTGFDLEFLGLVGFADPLRENVPPAIRECRSAQVRVVMITGDYPATARAIAERAGLDAGQTVDGPSLERLDEATLRESIRTTNVFARIMPEQKLRLVQALKADGEVVAMTGDGVNDAPALRAAHIGVAMGGRGTDVAREASAIVLLDDDFGSIVRTIRLGRRIYDNLRKASAYIVAVHIPIAGLALLPLLFGMPFMLSPIHIAFLEMVIDPVCSIAFEAEAEERDLMQRPPRAAASRLLSPGMMVFSLLQGALALVALAVVLLVGIGRDMPTDELRALMFTSLVLINVGLIVVNRSFSSSLSAALRRPNMFLWLLLSLVAGVLTVALTWPPAMDLFRFGPLHADDLGVTLIATVGLILGLEALKPWWRRSLRS
ncbi:cation-translocating P-type ATPase [uncultured Reyranella sp.]|uniref:cation-translocating P-type ATPase n=1 Tax=uncultured Reyranella sp. TaxID=735512 RepID=UPI0025DD9035|nr:cation-translocating P-type ATPase [uncultured Reyranella sp.]